MLKNKSIDYIFGMITGISVSITFWACTNTDLIASNDDASNELPNNTVQEVKITNWSDMPAVKISSSGNNVDIGNWSSMPSGGTVNFPSSMNVNVTNALPLDVAISTFGNNVDCNLGAGTIDVKVSNFSAIPVSVSSMPFNCCN